MAVVILPRSLVSLIPGTARQTEVEAGSVREAIDRPDERTPGLRNRLVDKAARPLNFTGQMRNAVTYVLRKRGAENAASD